MTELQAKVLGFLKEIDHLCRENDIEYYLTAGTLIGALRHKGFIPWDDDADIIMTRDNWEKFYKSVKDKLPRNIVLNSQYDNINLAMTANHYVDISTAALYRYDITNPEKNGIMIDIIIMDPVPGDEYSKQEYVNALTRYTELTLLSYQYSLRIAKSTHFSRYWAMSRILGMRKTLDHITRKAFHYQEASSQLYAQRFAGSPHFWPKEYYGKPRYVPFEDTMLPIPQRAGDCLCIGYDDEWMYVPQGGSTKSKHEFCVRSLTIPGELIAGDFEKHIDRKELMRTYVKRKKLMVSQTKNKFQTAMDSDLFLAAYIQLLYEKKDHAKLSALLENRDFEGLETYFHEYIKVQCTSHFLGSSSLEGWLNWYRKCNPMLIDIGDDSLYAVLVLLLHKQKLAWTGKLLKARRAIPRPLTQQLQEMDALYHAIKEANSAYECGDDNRCQEILNYWHPKYPDNAFLWKLNLKEKFRKGCSGRTLFDAVSVGLERFPDDPELLALKAEAYFDLGEHEQALEIYRVLSETTNHGLVLLHIKERVETMIVQEPENRALYEIWLAVRRHSGEENVPALETYFPVDERLEVPYASEDSNEVGSEASQTEGQGKLSAPHATALDHTLTAIQERRLKLLAEVAEICKANKIRYFLFGRALLQAARGGKYIDQYGDLVIAMTPANCKKFTQVVHSLDREDRYLDSMAENPRFHRFCVRYCDSKSLDFDVSQSGCGAQFGIYITIEVLRNPAKKYLINAIDQMLESGWETTNTMKWASPKRFISWLIVSTLCVLFGRKNVGKLLYNHFMNGPKRRATAQYFLKPFWGKRTYYPSYLFKYVRSIKLEGIPLNTMKLYTPYLKQVYGAKWKTKDFPMTKENLFTRIVDANISSQEYLAYLREKQIDRIAIWKLRNKTNRKYAQVNTLGTQTGHYWDIMCLCGERYRLLEKYGPMRNYIIELFRSNRINELTSLLRDYYDTAVAYSKKGLGLCFDKKIFEILEYTLFVKGAIKQARKLRSLVPKQDWIPISLQNNGAQQVIGMRKATAIDIPAILAYLKRYVKDCLYMYIDIGKYGLENPNMKVWFDATDNGINIVVMKYHTSISIYTDTENWDVEAVAQLIHSENVESITGTKAIMERLYPLCADDYEITFGSVFRLSKTRDFDFEGMIELATEQDTLEIARLIIEDPGIGSYYEVQDLADQLAERMRTNMGRSFVIRENRKIVAHIASYAEYDGLATTGGLIVAPIYRNGLYGGVLESKLVHTLLQENFQVYTFVTERLRKKLLTAWGNECVGEYGKITRTVAGA